MQTAIVSLQSSLQSQRRQLLPVLLRSFGLPAHTQYVRQSQQQLVFVTGKWHQEKMCYQIKTMIDNIVRNLPIQNEGRFICPIMIVGMILARVRAHSFLRNIDDNTPHQTCMVSASDHDSEFPMLNMTKRQQQLQKITLSNVNLALNRTHLMLFHEGTE